MKPRLISGESPQKAVCRHSAPILFAKLVECETVSLLSGQLTAGAIRTDFIWEMSDGAA